MMGINIQPPQSKTIFIGHNHWHLQWTAWFRLLERGLALDAMVVSLGQDDPFDTDQSHYLLICSIPTTESFFKIDC
jgi:hypothetical protein